ncbi:MAG TPA: DinB family protein [Candidatus Limnocylindrales bacterium]|nr:DinB family protein [Candidatus Limnocylindrales bacterium]
MDAAIERFEAAARQLGELGPEIEAGEPWPLSPAYGEEPEADWGPKELLAHVAEMIPYWIAQIEAILARDAGSDPAPFGRVATDAARIARIGADRQHPAGALLERIEASAAVAANRLRALDPAQRARRGLHPRRGELTVEAIVPPFLADHLAEHVRQLREILARR